MEHFANGKAVEELVEGRRLQVTGWHEVFEVFEKFEGFGEQGLGLQFTVYSFQFTVEQF